MSQLELLSWQKDLFAERLNRFKLMRLKPTGDLASFGFRIHRNHGVEPVATALAPFLAFSGWVPNLWIGDYDDSLAFPRGHGDVELVWLDFDRYSQMSDGDLIAWLGQRLDALRSQSDAALIVANAHRGCSRAAIVNPLLQAWSGKVPRVQVLDLDALTGMLGDGAFSPQRAILTGTSLSDMTCLEAARRLGLRHLPSVLAPRLKAIAVDLDETLYAGVLGEDGFDNVKLTDGHRALHEKLIELHSAGMLLVAVSKNERKDVDRLFATRTDFPLRPEHFSDWRVSWSPKSDGLRAAAKTLRIGLDAFVFLDDNLGELTTVSKMLPQVRLIYAGDGPAQSCSALDMYPNIAADRLTATDALRAADLKANEEREALAAEATDPMSYLASLGVAIRIAYNPGEDRARLTEICAKTNQFNLAIARLDPLQIERYLVEKERCAVMIYMKDRLADSGSVGALFMHREGGVLVIDELCVSCRAMGRLIEDTMISAAIQLAQQFLPSQTVRFKYTRGPRNEPGLTWLSKFASVNLDEAGAVDVPWDAAQRAQGIAATPVSIHWSH